MQRPELTDGLLGHKGLLSEGQGQGGDEKGGGGEHCNEEEFV